MDVVIKLNSVDISTSVISYNRQHKICSGIGSLDLTLEAKTERTIDPWDEIIVEEGGDQVAIYYVSGSEKTAPDGEYVITAQDASKRLTDYFIKESYEITYPSTAKYWIELFLTEVDVPYTFDVTDNGAPLAENSQLGLKSVYDEVINLLQLSGWYMYFDSSGTCRIGKLDLTAGEVDYTFDDSDVTKVLYRKDDKYLRNRAVVWGAGDPDTGQWVFADTSTLTPWNRDDGDYRTIVYANPNIKTTAIAYTLAFRLLTEFSLIIFTKEIEIIGTHGIIVGERIRLNSDYMEYDGIVTTLEVSMSSDGLVTRCIMDERCPRLFGYAHWTGYVYVGTYSDGVYRRLLRSTSWENYSTGLTDLSIVDLSAYDGLLGTVTATGVFFGRHTQNAAWVPFTPTAQLDVSMGSGLMVASGLRAVACTIDRYSGITGTYAVAFTAPAVSGIAPSGTGGETISGYQVPTSGNLSWVIGLSANRVPTYSHQIYVGSGESKNYDITVLDIEALDTGSNVVTVRQVEGGFITPISGGDDGYYGYCRAGMSSSNSRLGYGGGDPSAYNSLPPATSGVWMETSYWQSYYPGAPGDVWWGPSMTIQGNPILHNLITPSGGTTYYSYIYNTPSGIIKREILTRTLYYDEFWEEYYFDSNTDYLYIANPFSPTSNEFVDYFYQIDEETYSFVRLDAVTDSVIYKKISLNNPTSFTTTTAALEDGGNWYDPDGDYASFADVGGGNYYIVVYIDADNRALKLLRLDMRDGTYSYQTIHNAYDEVNPPPDTGDYLEITKINQSANYLYFGAIWGGEFKNGVISSDKKSLTIYLDLITVVVNKITGTVSVNTEVIEETFQHPNYQTVDILTSNLLESKGTYFDNPRGGYTGFRRSNFTITAENPDSGAGWSGFNFGLVWFCNVDTDGNGFTNGLDDFILTAYYTGGLPDAGLSRVDVLNNVWSNRTSTWLLNDAKAWMHLPDSTYFRVSNRIQSAPSRLGYPPVLWDVYTTAKDGTALPAMVDYLNRESYTEMEMITRGVGYNNAIGECAPKVDDVEGIVYASIVSKHPSLSTYYFYIVGYDFSGNIVKKIQQDGQLATDSNGYFFFRSSFTPWAGADVTIVFDNIVVHDYQNRSISVTNDQRYRFYSILPYVSGLYNLVDRCYVLRHDITPPSGNFTLIYTHSDPLYVDAAKGSPTVIYEYPASGAVVISGVQAGGNSHLLGVSWLNEWDTFEVDHLPAMPIFSVRAFDITQSGNFPPMESGNTSPSGFLDRYLGIAAGYEGIKRASSTLNPPDYGVIKTFPGSGEVTQVDFTNFEEDPYIVASVRGASTSGVFFQRSPESPIFVDVTSGLPPSEIMIIRIDDKV